MQLHPCSRPYCSLGNVFRIGTFDNYIRKRGAQLIRRISHNIVNVYARSARETFSEIHYHGLTHGP